MSLPFSLLLGATEIPNASVSTIRELDWPASPLGWTLWLGAAVVGCVWVWWWYRRDAANLGPFWRWALSGLRLVVWGALLLIALNPHDRTQRMSYRPSRVAVLVDTSLSMRHAADDEIDDGSAPVSRSQRAIELLKDAELWRALRAQHEVSLYTFNAALSNAVRVWPTLHPGLGDAATDESTNPTETALSRPADADLDWASVVEPRGVETRLGEVITEAVRQTAGRSLAGIVVISDGASNAGIDAVSARDAAAAAKARLVTVGLGTTTQPTNLAVVDVQVPTDVQKGDPYEFIAFVQGQGVGNREVAIELVELAGDETVAGSSAETVVASQTVLLPEGGATAEARFTRQTTAPGSTRYVVRALPVPGVRDANPEDNSLAVTVNVFDRPTRVLLIAGGPMRDYQFVRNLVFRHKSMDLDVYLQTAGVGSSQESNELLSSFPATREKLYEYDVIVAFDPDWSAIPAESIKLLSEWVFQEAGGLLLVAGDVNTPQLASSGRGTEATGEDPLQPLRQLYPVVLGSYFASSALDVEATQPWPVTFTEDGQGAGFLQLTDEAVSSLARWKEFPGIYRCYPTTGQKAGATIYARFSDPRAQPEPPILMASQFFGQGRVFYLGSPEMWRLRATGEADYDRFWIKTIREMGQGRTKRGTRRGLLIPESRRLVLGQTERVRARLLDSQFQPLDLESVELEVFDPSGRPMIPPRKLTADATRPGEFVGDFRVVQPGTYRLELLIPESRDVLREEVVVALPRLEDEEIRQNVAVLRDLAAGTNGTYLTFGEAARRLPEVLPHVGEPFLVDERLRTLWDRDWVLYALVGLLGVEWLCRKLLRLA